MTGEIKFFRKRFIGGFNRQDVVEFIADLARERDENLALKEKAQQNLQDLLAEMEALKLERDEAKRLAAEYKSEVLDAARKTLVEFEASFAKLGAEFEEETTSICTQLLAARSIMTVVPGTLKEAGAKISGLRALLDKGNDSPDSLYAQSSYAAIPAQPYQPNQPVQPYQPVQAAQPIQVAQTVAPVAPTQPTQPIQAVQLI